MRIFVAGASGVIGVRLVPLLVGAGHVVALTVLPERAHVEGSQATGEADRLRQNFARDRKSVV